MIVLYNFFIRLYVFAIGTTALWNKKAKQWIDGRKDLFNDLKKKINTDDKIIWMHCASAGEFEQGKPVIEELKKNYPAYKILVSFFSPSGYAVAEKYTPVDVIAYLPADTSKNAKRFVETVNPQLVIFVKYEYWHHHLKAVAFRHISLIMISAIFRKDQLFFKAYGKFYLQLLFLFRHIFVQDKNSFKLLKEKNITHCSVAGDTRFDRVRQTADHFSELDLIKYFVGDNKAIVAGSTWYEDEKILAEYVRNQEIKMVIAPHEIKPNHINHLQQIFSNAILYSQIKNVFNSSESKSMIWDSINQQQQKNVQQTFAKAKTLIIDNVGMLSKLYYYATITYVGGGFNKSGIHNTLEAAVYGKPVFFGPNYQKFKEAKDLINSGGAFSVSNSEELKTKADYLLNHPQKLSEASEASQKYVKENTGAAKKILQFIQENRLLTN